MLVMPFNSTWHEFLNQIDELSERASLVTPLSHRRFQIANTQEQRIIISFADEDGYQPLQPEQFESLYDRPFQILSIQKDNPNGCLNIFQSSTLEDVIAYHIGDI